MPRPFRSPGDAESGSALIWALLFMVLTSGMVVSHSTFLASSRQEREARYNRDSLAATFARSGLVEATNWFQERARQPVLTFDPALDPEASPPIRETIDPALGLVREFEINGNLWGRYEVRKDEAFDISPQRGAILGTAWELRIRSYIYRRNDPDKAYDEKPNRLIATTALTDEIRQLRLNQPVAAAVSIDDPADLTLGPHARIHGGGGAAIGHRDMPASPGPVIDGEAVVEGAMDYLGVPTYDADPKSVFGADTASLRSFADVVMTRATTRAFDLTGPIEIKNTTMFIPRSLFVPLPVNIENSLIFIDGDLRMTALSPSKIQGLIYVTGDATFNGPIEIDGALIVRGHLTVGTQGFGTVVIRLDQAVVQRLRGTLNRYRRRRVRQGEDGA